MAKDKTKEEKEERKINKTAIEWCLNPDGTPGYTWNPITGCLNGCSYCYARRLANGRLKQRYLANLNISYEDLCPNPDLGGLHSLRHSKDPFYPRFWEEKLKETQPSGKGIFVCDMSDLFGIGIPHEWTEQIMDIIKVCSWNRYYLLTKQPQNLIRWSPFPENCWVGVTATNSDMCFDALAYLAQIHATVKYISFEPLLSPVYDISLVKGSILRELGTGLEEAGVHWVILGACTGTLNELKPLLLKYPELNPMPSDMNLMPYGKKWTLQPKIEWVEEIVRAAGKAGIPVFLKNNLKPILPEELPYYEVIDEDPMMTARLRQEMPKAG